MPVCALQFPDHFPPKDRWGKFFIGVRWLGPDLSFFKQLKRQQAQRTAEQMSAWGGGSRQQVAQAISSVLSQQLGWKSKVFLPEDSVAVVFHGPRFDFNDPESAFEEVIEVLRVEFRISMPEPLWQKQAERTLGELVDDLLGNTDA
jgi:hypothetical protein